MHGKKADENLVKAVDPSRKPSDRADAAHDAAKEATKETKHAAKAECCAHDHKC